MTPAHGVWALDGAGPYPCDDRGVGAVGEFDLGVKVSDALKGAGFHPLAVVIDVFGESYGALEGVRLEKGGASAEIDGRESGEFGRNLDHRLVDHDGDGVQIVGVGLESESLGLKGNGATARKRIEKLRHIVAERFSDFLARFGHDVGILGVFPSDMATSISFLSALIARLHQGGASVLVACLRSYHKVNYIHNHRMITNNLPTPQIF